MSSPAPLKVLYIEGSGRSGSTILDNVLGQVDGFFSVGELRFLWDRHLIEDRVCGCGQAFSACPVWTAVLDAAFAGTGGIDPAQVVALREAAMRLRSTHHTLSERGVEALRRRHAPLLDVLSRLYHAVSEVTGARVVVDSSKYPSYGYLLGLVPGLEVSVVHLVRDPRAVAYSWTRHKVDRRSIGDVGPMARYSPASTARGWALWSALCEVYAIAEPVRTLRLRYEDFAADPRGVLDQVLAHVGEQGRALPFLDGRTVALAGNHTVGGNPSRFRTGDVELREDDEWRQGMTTRDKAVVTAWCLPLLHRYGYLSPRLLTSAAR